MKKRLLIFDTHPIQYRSPVFREVYSKYPDAKVYYFNPVFDGRKWWFHEFGKIPKQNFDVPYRDGFSSEVLNTDQWSLFWKYRRLRRILLEEKPDTILIYGYYLPEHWILRFLAARLGIKILFVGETFEKSGSWWRRTLKSLLVRLYFGGVEYFIAIGEKTRAHYEAFGIPTSKILSGKYCIDPAFFKLEPSASEDVRKKIRREQGVPEDALVVLFVGRLFDRKRPLDVLTVHQALLKNEKIYTWIVGNGPMEEELRSQAIHLPRVQMLGFKNQHQVKELYHASDLLIVPSEYETWGLVVNEAFSCGRPALVTERCGVAGDLVIEGKTGAIFPVGDTAGMAKKIQKLEENRSLLKTWGRSAEEHVTASYRPDQFASVILQGLNPT